MFLHLLASIRHTESWTSFHGLAVVIVGSGVYLLIRSLRVRGRR